MFVNAININTTSIKAKDIGGIEFYLNGENVPKATITNSGIIEIIKSLFLQWLIEL